MRSVSDKAARGAERRRRRTDRSPAGRGRGAHASRLDAHHGAGRDAAAVDRRGGKRADEDPRLLRHPARPLRGRLDPGDSPGADHQAGRPGRRCAPAGVSRARPAPHRRRPGDRQAVRVPAPALRRLLRAQCRRRRRGDARLRRRIDLPVDSLALSARPSTGRPAGRLGRALRGRGPRRGQSLRPVRLGRRRGALSSRAHRLRRGPGRARSSSPSCRKPSARRSASSRSTAPLRRSDSCSWRRPSPG